MSKRTQKNRFTSVSPDAQKNLFQRNGSDAGEVIDSNSQDRFDLIISAVETMSSNSVDSELQALGYDPESLAEKFSDLLADGESEKYHLSNHSIQDDLSEKSTSHNFSQTIDEVENLTPEELDQVLNKLGINDDAIDKALMQLDSPTLSSQKSPSSLVVIDGLIKETNKKLENEKAMKSKHILVTGGAGFIGSALSKALLEKGHKVDCVDNLITGYSESVADLKSNDRFHFIEKDITSTEFLTMRDQNHYDEIYHLACPTGVPNIKILGEEMIRTCSFGTDYVMQVARAHNAKVVYTSSAEIYGDPEVFPQHEGYYGNVNPVGERSPYEEGKRFSETIVAEYVRKYQIDATIVRLANAFGPGMSLNDQRVIPQFINKIKQGKKITIYGDGSQTRTLIYIDDLVNGLILAMNKGHRGDVYNISGADEISITELYKMMKFLTGRDIEVEFQPHFIKDHMKRLPSVKKIVDLGWKAEVGLRAGLARVLNRHGLLDKSTDSISYLKYTDTDKTSDPETSGGKPGFILAPVAEVS